MKGRKDNYKVSSMMIVTVVIVFVVLTAVTFAFEMLQKRQEKRISTAKNASQNETTLEIRYETAENQEIAIEEADTTDRAASESEIKIDSEEARYQIESMMEEEPVGSEAEIVFLIKGDNKGSNKYARVDKLSYTETIRYTEAQLACLDTYGLRITRNEIYARHGRMFNDQELQEYFTNQDWYVPQSASGNFDESCLNEVEKYNSELIRAYELKQWN